MCMVLLLYDWSRNKAANAVYRLIGQQVTDIAFQTELEFTSDRIYLLLYFILSPYSFPKPDSSSAQHHCFSHQFLYPVIKNRIYLF